MTDKIVKLQLVTPKPNEHVIALLEDALEQARRGEIHAAALVIETTEGGTVMFHLGDTGAWPLLGGLEHVKDSIMRAVRKAQRGA